MLYKVQQAEVIFQKTFQSLAFDVARLGIEILREISQRIGPRYSIRTEDMSVYGGANLSEVRVSVLLFRGSGDLQVTPERLFLKFTNVRGEEDFKIIRDIALLAEGIVKSTIPNIAFKEDVIQIATFINLIEKSMDGPALLNSFAEGSAAASRLSTSALGATGIHFELKTEIENVKDKWKVTYEINRSILGPETLFLTSIATYEEGGTISSIGEKFSHADESAEQFLGSLGLHKEEVESENI